MVSQLPPSFLANPTLNQEGAIGEVSGNESEKVHPWTQEALKEAVGLRLGMVPATPEAERLVETLTARCLEQEGAGRKTKRRAIGTGKLRRAVGAIVGNVLTRWLHRNPVAVFQTHSKEAFTGELVGYAQYVAAEKALLALNLMETKKGVSYPRRDGLSDVPAFDRHAARIRPAPPLLDLAANHGLGPENIGFAFRTEYPKAPVQVPERNLVVVREVLDFHTKRARVSAQRLPDVEALPIFQPIRQEVADANSMAAAHAFEGCRPPSWARVFTREVHFNGRWQAKGASYQIMRKSERAAIRIDSEPVVELDIRASYLTILAALAGAPMPPGDPYQAEGIPSRDVVKHWVHVTQGNGRTPRWWSAETRKERPDVARWPVKEVQRAVVARMPFLADPAAPYILEAAGMEDFVGTDIAPRLLSLRLMGIEAEAMTLAMRTLRAVGVVALPVHDSLIVPRSAAVVARDAIQEACEATYGAVPVVTGLPE